MISIIIPAKNETKLNNFLKEVLALKGGKEIIVEKRKTRAQNMNAGAKKAKGDILLFLHADTKLPKNAIQLIKKTIKKNKIGAFSIEFNQANLFLKIIARATSLRSRINKIAYGDQAIFVTKELFNQLEGFKDLPFLEDVDFMKRSRKVTKIKVLKNKVTTSPRRWEKDGMLRRTIKNRIIMTLYSLGIHPNTLKKLY